MKCACMHTINTSIMETDDLLADNILLVVPGRQSSEIDQLQAFKDKYLKLDIMCMS